MSITAALQKNPGLDLSMFGLDEARGMLRSAALTAAAREWESSRTVAAELYARLEDDLALTNLGDRCFEQGQMGAGETAYTLAGKIIPLAKFEQAGDFHFEKARGPERLGGDSSLEAAVPCYERAESPDKLCEVADYALGQKHPSEGVLRTAIKALSSARNGERLFSLAQEWADKNRRHYLSETALESAIDLGYDVAKSALFSRGEQYILAGQEKKGLAAIEKSRVPIMSADYKRWGTGLLRQGKVDNALRMCSWYENIHWEAAGDALVEEHATDGELYESALKGIRQAVRCYQIAGKSSKVEFAKTILRQSRPAWNQRLADWCAIPTSLLP